tara:strand:+ start:1002 stop:1196 length:195 start_codon:yes stop_codon:yes gene_type:complete
MTVKEILTKIKAENVTHMLLPTASEREFYTTRQVLKSKDIEEVFPTVKVIVMDEVNEITLLKKV